MKKIIRICDGHNLVTNWNNKIGVVGEINAEQIYFIKPTHINGEKIENFTTELVFNNTTSDGLPSSYVYQLDGDTFTLRSELTTNEKLTLMVRFLKGSEVKWKSYTTTFTLADSADESGYNPASAQRTADLSDLQNSFAENIGEDYSDYEWEELIGQSNEETPEESYQTGVLYQLRETLSNIAKFAVDSSNVAKFTINESIPILSQAFIRDKMSLIELLNDVLEPESEYTMSTTFNDIFEETARLPAEIQTRLNIAVTDAQVTYRRQLDTALNAVVQQYSLSVDLDKADTWLSTLNNLSSVCVAIHDSVNVTEIIDAEIQPSLTTLYNLFTGGDLNA